MKELNKNEFLFFISQFSKKDNIDGKLIINYEKYSKVISKIEKQILSINNSFFDFTNDDDEIMNSKENYKAGDLIEEVNNIDNECNDYLMIISDISKQIQNKFFINLQDTIENLDKKNITNLEKSADEVEAEFIDFMDERMDMDALYFSGDIRLIMDFINQRGYILKFHMISFLISFYLAMSNFKNFAFTKTQKSYIEGHLDILNILKNRCDTYKNISLKRRILEDEAIFLENNKERLRKIREEKEIEIDLSDSSEEEENSSSDFVDI